MTLTLAEEESVFEIEYIFSGKGESLSAKLETDSPDDDGVCPFHLSFFHHDITGHPDYDPKAMRLIVTRGIRLEEASSIREEFQKTTVPCVPEARMVGGFDGETHEIRITRGITEASYRWWMDVPDGWEHLATMALRFKRLAEAVRIDICNQQRKQ